MLQKVLEQDERPSRAMILCISQILRPDASAAPQGSTRSVCAPVSRQKRHHMPVPAI